MKKPYRLTADFIKRVKRPGIFGDGRGSSGLQLRVHQTKHGDLSKSWRQMLRIDGRVTTRGLGSWPFISLGEARRLAMVNRVAVMQTGQAAPVVPSPVALPVEPAPAPARVAKPSPTFLEAAEAVIQLRRPGWRNGATEEVWRSTLAHAGGLASKPVASFTSADIMEVVEPLWTEKPSVGKRMLAYCRVVARYALAHDFRTDDPTEAARAGLQPQKAKAEHYTALRFSQVPGAMRKLASARMLAARLNRFTILTAVRGGEARGMRWAEIDMDESLWTIPGSRTKTGEAHAVPLSRQARALLPTKSRTGLVFPNTKGAEQSRKAASRAFSALGVSATLHGFRSSFRDWAAETGVSREVAECCLAHVLPGVQAAYRRTDLIDARRDVMQAWADFATP